MHTPVIYQIYVDAFARGASGRAPGRERGGDLEGVLDRLDYVAGLGADAIWLTPIFPAPSDHGYNITDYFRVDPRLAPTGGDGAGEELFRAVVDAAHARSIGILLDLPLNHVGHDYDLGTVPGLHVPRVREPRTRQERGWARDLKYFDHDDEATRAFLFNVARFWVERFNVDGYRYDYVHGIANPFWEALYRELRTLRGDLFVVGEHWDDFGSPQKNAEDIASRFDGAEGPCFDTLFDFPFQAAAVEALSSGDPGPLAGILDFCGRTYPRPGCAMLDNHDTARIADWADGDDRRMGLAMRLLATRTGPISLLYGTEIGLRSHLPPRPNFDESSRVPMDWAAIDAPLVALTRRLFMLRRDHAAVARGTTIARSAEGGVLVEVKEAEGRRVVVALNFRGVAARIDRASLSGPDGQLDPEPLCGGDRLDLDGAAEIGPYGGGVYRVRLEA